MIWTVSVPFDVNVIGAVSSRVSKSASVSLVSTSSTISTPVNPKNTSSFATGAVLTIAAAQLMFRSEAALFVNRISPVRGETCRARHSPADAAGYGF